MSTITTTVHESNLSAFRRAVLRSGGSIVMSVFHGTAAHPTYLVTTKGA